MESSKKNKYLQIEIVCRLLSQDITKQPESSLIILSEEVLLTVKDFTEKDKYHYCLYIENNDKKLDSNWEHLTFDIKPSMNLCKFINNESDYIQFNTQKSIYFLEILIDDSNNENKENFFNLLEMCLCSLDKNIPINKAKLQLKKSSKNYIKNLETITDMSTHIENETKKLKEINEKENLEKNSSSELSNNQLTQQKIENVISLEVAKKIFTAQGDLFNFDSQIDELVKLSKDEKVLLTIYKKDKNSYEYYLCTETLNGYLKSIDIIEDNMNGQVINRNDVLYVWITKKCYEKTTSNCLGFCFDRKEDAKEFQSLLNKCNYESKNKQSFDKIDEENKNLLEKAVDYDNINCFTADDEKEKEEEEVLMDIDEENFKEIEVENDKEKINKFCLDSLSNDRTFCITDDNQIVVYKANQDDDIIQKLSSLPVIQEFNGKNVSLKNGLLYKSENNMLLLDENNPYVVYQYDLPKSKIVSEWKTDKIAIDDICNSVKNGQTTDASLVYGVNSKAVFTMDDRVNNKNNIGEIKTYSNKIHTNRILANNNGQFVTGSTKGDLRFYDKVGVKAKNLFSFYGDPIRYIDISSDDKYILVTCDKYLLLINTEKKGEKNAFLKTILTSQRKTPLKLQIETTVIAKYGLNDANFTSAKFNVNKKGENNIITSLGEYIIIWNFCDIKKGKINNYKIEKVNDLVIDNYFKAGKGNKIIVAMPTKLRMQSQKNISG